MIAEKKKNLPEPEILSVPEVKATSVKGAGLEAVRSSLRSLIDVAHMPLREYEMTAENTELQIERQKLLEEHAFESAQERWKKDSEAKDERGILNLSQPVNALLWDWHQAFVPLIKEELLRVDKAETSSVKAPGDTDRCLYGPLMRLIEPEKIAAIVIVELLKTHVSTGTGDGPKTSQAVLSIGKQLEMEYLSQEIQKKKNSGVFGHLKKSDLAELFHKRAAFAAVIAKARASSGTAPEPTLGMIPEWPLSVKAKV
jgi:DNA-directed RNA polymerase